MYTAQRKKSIEMMLGESLSIYQAQGKTILSYNVHHRYICIYLNRSFLPIGKIDTTKSVTKQQE